MSSKLDGKYTGTVAGVSYEKDTYHEDGLVVCFDINLDGGGAVRAKHSTHGDYAHIFKQIVVDELGLEWPKGVGQLSDIVGRQVRVKLKTRTSSRGKEFQNAYIETSGGRGETAEVEDINKTLRALGAEVEDGDLPF